MPWLQIDQSKVYYRSESRGPAIIALHSSSSHSGQWKQLSRQVEGQFTVIAPDLFGYGKSDPLPDRVQPYWHHDLQIAATLLAAVGEPAHLVGHSLGGTVALRVALEHSDRVASLTLIEPVQFSLLEEARDPRRQEYLDLAHAMMVLVRYGHDERAARLFLDFWVGVDALDQLDRDTREYVVQTIGRVAEDWYGVSSHAPGNLQAADLTRLSVPTLLLCAEHTKASARGIVEIVAKAVPHAEVNEIAGAGHMSPVTHPDAVNQHIVDFIARQETGSV